MTNTTTASWSELMSGPNALRSIALAGGVALHAINIFIATTILPSVVRDIGGLEYYTWNTTLFAAASIMGSACCARLMSVLGARQAYLLALAIFSLGAIICATAPTMYWLLAGRSVQGLGGGVLFALSYSLIRIVFEARLWSRAMGIVSGMWGTATLFGPAIGGIFAQMGNWRLAFWVLLPAAVLLAIIVIAQLPGKSSSDQHAGRIPLGKISLLVLSVIAISAASLSDQPIWQLTGVAIGLALGCLIARLDSRAKVKLLPTGAYSINTRQGAVNAIMALLMFGITVEIFIPYFMQIIHGHTPIVAGYLNAVMAGGWTIASITSSSRGGPTANRLIRIGAPVMLMSLLAMAVMTPQGDTFSSGIGLIIYCVVLALLGFGVGVGWPHILTRVLTFAPVGEESLASSSITTIQLYATAVAAAVAGLVANSAGLTNPGGIAGASSAAVWLFSSFAIAPALAIWLIPRIIRTSGK